MKKDTVNRPKVLIGLSGGIDSSVAAGLLSTSGYEVCGIHFLTWKEDYSQEKETIERVKKIGKTLGINIEIVDVKEEFRKWVVEEFLEELKRGRTPNPCIICNKRIKFNLLVKIAKKLNFDYIATGHYARVKEIKFRKGIQYALLQGADRQKDQSYFLYRTNQEVLAKTLLPLGELTKDKVRSLSSKFHFPVNFDKESQEICFIPDSLKDFLYRHLKSFLCPGKVVDINGEIVGQHFGLPLYTEGQRHGFLIEKQISLDKDPQPLYVLKKDIKNNLLIVGQRERAESKFLQVENVNLIRESLGANFKHILKVKIRSSGSLIQSQVTYHPKFRLCKVILFRSQIGVSPGQSAVFYRQDEVVGGGVII